MQSAKDLRRSASISEAISFQCWLRRLWPVYCFLAALVTFGYALYDPFQIDGDATAYMDIGDLIRAHNWHGIINGYWNPLYPAALGHAIFHPTRFTELHAHYMVNFGIFLLEMLAIVVFADAISQLRDLRATATEPASATSFLLDRYVLRYLALALLIISSQRELSMGKVRPDALLQAFLLFALAALLKHLATHRLRYAALMGLALGFAYLAKSFAFVFSFLCIIALIAFRIVWQRSSPARAVAAGLLALVCFSVVAGPTSPRSPTREAASTLATPARSTTRGLSAAPRRCTSSRMRPRSSAPLTFTSSTPKRSFSTTLRSTATSSFRTAPIQTGSITRSGTTASSRT